MDQPVKPAQANDVGQDAATPPPTTPAPATPQAVDVAIIGAGIIGLAIGWRLALRGVSVAIFDTGAAWSRRSGPRSSPPSPARTTTRSTRA